MSPEWAKPEKYLTIRKSQVKLQGTRPNATPFFISQLVMLLSIQRYCQCSGHRMQGGGCPMGHDSSGCICSIVSLVLPPESATSTWSGYLLLLLVVGLAGFGWVWVAEEQLMLMMIHTQVRFGYSSWVNTQTGHTHTWTGRGLPSNSPTLTHTHGYTGTRVVCAIWRRLSWLWRCCRFYLFMPIFGLRVREFDVPAGLWLVCYCWFSAGFASI